MRRAYDAILTDHLARHRQMAFVSGPRQAGKTTACRQVFPEPAYINWDKLGHRRIILTSLPRLSVATSGHPAAAAAGSHRDTACPRGAHQAAQAAAQARPHRSPLSILALGRVDAPDPRPPRRHLPSLRGTHEATRPGPRPREHRALPPPPGSVDRAARPRRAPAAALLPQHHPPQADPPGRAVRVGRASRRRAGVCPSRAHCSLAYGFRVAGSSSRGALPSKFARSLGSSLPLFRTPDPLESSTLRNICRQVHRGADLLGDLLALDEGDEVELGLALPTDNLETEGFSQQLRPRDIPRLADGLALLVDGDGLGGRGNNFAA